MQSLKFNPYLTLFIAFTITSCTSLTPEETNKRVVEYYKQRGLSEQDAIEIKKLEDRQKHINSRQWNKIENYQEFQEKKTLDTYKASLEMAEIFKGIDEGRHKNTISKNMEYVQGEIDKIEPKKKNTNSSADEYNLANMVVAGVGAWTGLSLYQTGKEIFNPEGYSVPVQSNNKNQSKDIKTNKDIKNRSESKVIGNKNSSGIKSIEENHHKSATGEPVYKITCNNNGTYKYYYRGGQWYSERGILDISAGLRDKDINYIAESRCKW